MNGFRLGASQKELEGFALSVAVGRVQLEKATAWLQRHTVKKIKG